MKTKAELEDLIRECDLDAHWEKILNSARTSIRFVLEETPEEELPLGSSKLGGSPDLPPDVEWFANPESGQLLSFVAQINFAETKEYDLEGELPDSGILYLFYDAAIGEGGMPWGYDPKDGAGKKVLFYDGDLSVLERRTPPEELEEEGLAFGCVGVKFENHLELPNPYSDLVSSWNLSGEENDSYIALWDGWNPEMSQDFEEFCKLLGHSDNMQFGMEEECALVTHGIYCGGADWYSSEEARRWKQTFADWGLLLQITSSEDLGMLWGDDGLLYLWITEEDLNNRNFEKSWLILQCG